MTGIHPTEPILTGIANGRLRADLPALVPERQGPTEDTPTKELIAAPLPSIDPAPDLTRPCA
jgi:hypothetical protein